MSTVEFLRKNATALLVLAIGLLVVVPVGAMLSSSALAGSRLVPAGASGADTLGLAPFEVTSARSVTATPAPTGAKGLLSSLPSRLLKVPWIASLAHTGPHLSPLTSLPNLALLRSPPAPNGTINPFYVAQPAPLGLADYGLGATTYSYNTSHFLGEVTINSPPEVTDPASTSVIEPSGAHDGYVGSVYEFGVQLNTVATNISIPGSDQGFFWTQNVIDWNATGIHFVDDTFNLTSATQDPYYIAPGTIYQACGNGSAGIDRILFNYGGVFQCVGGTLPVTPAAYPITVQLYNNASVNAQHRTQVAYGYRVDEAGIGRVFTGVSDVVVFNSPGAPRSSPANPPGFSVDGFAPSPPGLFRDAEIDLVGDIGGDNSVFRAINGTVHLEYSNATSGGYRSVPSAYNFGGDTGETSTGIADYWTASHALEINQGPAMLYGLWGAEPWVSVRSGDIHLEGAIAPSYGFVFVSNTPPVLDPFGTGLRDNLSWLPTTDAGTFNTYLPPLGAPWTSQYYVQAFAAGSAELNGSAVRGSNTSYLLSLAAAPGVLRAPLYMFSNAQAAELAMNVTGSSTAPYTFNGLIDNVNTTFNHLNDYGFPTFVLLMAQGVTKPIDVNNTYEGSDSSTGNFYLYDFALPLEQGLLYPGPANSTSLPYFTSGINIYNGIDDQISNQTLAADGYGLQIVLWQDLNARAHEIVSLYLSSGVWVGDSTGTRVTDVAAELGGTGITDIGSKDTAGAYLEVLGALAVGYPSIGVASYSSSGGSFTYVLAANGATGLVAGDNYGPSADYDPYYYLPGSHGTSYHEVVAYNGSLGANVSLSEGTRAGEIYALNDSVALVLDASPGARIVGVHDWNSSVGVVIVDSRSSAVTGVTTWNDSIGVWGISSDALAISHVKATASSEGVYLASVANSTVDGVTAIDYSLGVYLDNCTNITISHVIALDHSTQVYVA